VEEMMPKVAVVMGSKSDEAAVAPALDVLKEMKLDYEVHVISAHRTPDRARQFALEARDSGYELIIAAAGMAAALPGVIAGWTTLPVIGVPLAGSELRGVDALYAIVQMPPGIPVATVAIGGTRNAAYLAAEILGLKYPEVADAYASYRRSLQGDNR
jgi:5-(carboxyamino)imidazole ribonucleotide mutase